jgi:hypothetical protein
MDPVDDCTFWYTQEYIHSSSNWNTRIANFKFPSCGAGGGGGAAVNLSTSLLKFNKLPIAQTSLPLSVTLTNVGSDPLTIFSMTATGDYQISSNTCGTSVAPGANCVIGVTFTPTRKGTRNGVLTFSDDALDSPQIVSLKGTGQSIAVSPTALNFGTVALGNTSEPRDVTVTNVGTATVTFTGTALAGTAAADYLISANTCGATLTAGTNCTISVEFRPTKLGARNAKLNIKNNGGGSPSSANVTGVGN